MESSWLTPVTADSSNRLEAPWPLTEEGKARHLLVRGNATGTFVDVKLKKGEKGKRNHQRSQRRSQRNRNLLPPPQAAAAKNFNIEIKINKNILNL